MEQKDGWTLSSSLKLPKTHSVRPEETCPEQDSSPQVTQVFNRTEDQTVFSCHAVIGVRPYCSPEYSPDFYKQRPSACRPLSHVKAETKTRILYSEKKRLLDKQEEIQEVKQLNEWKPAESIFTAVLEGLRDKGS